MIRPRRDRPDGVGAVAAGRRLAIQLFDHDARAGDGFMRVVMRHPPANGGLGRAVVVAVVLVVVVAGRPGALRRRGERKREKREEAAGQPQP